MKHSLSNRRSHATNKKSGNCASIRIASTTTYEIASSDWEWHPNSRLIAYCDSLRHKLHGRLDLELASSCLYDRSPDFEGLLIPSHWPTGFPWGLRLLKISHTDEDTGESVPLHTNLRMSPHRLATNSAYGLWIITDPP